MYDAWDSAAAALRELAVYLSYDRDAALERGDKGLADTLQRRWEETHALANDLHDRSPDTVDASAATLAETRALADQLARRLARMAPSSTARRAYVAPSERTTTLAPMDRVVAYLRVSTARQAEGYGLDVQEAAVRMWAKKHRVRLAFVVTDVQSGAEDAINRPALAEALGHVEAGRVRAIVVPRLDRIARDLILQELVRAELVRAGAELRSADPYEDAYLLEDPDNPSGKLIRRVIGAVAEYERDMIRLRMSAGKAKKADAGGYTGGRPPYGFRSHGRDLVPNLDEQRQLSRMKRWRREGKSWREIADRLNAEGIPARAGGRWFPATVRRVAERPMRAAS